AGDSFVIIDNGGPDPLHGTFNGLAEGAVLNVGGSAFQITYAGGSGNDVALTSVAQPSRFESITALSNGQMQLRATGGVSGVSYTIEAATNLNPVIHWSNIGAVFTDGNGILSFTDTNAPLFPMRF